MITKKAKSSEKSTGVDVDIKYLTATVEKLKKHFQKHKHDYRTKRALTIKEAKLKKLKEYKERKKSVIKES